MDKGKVKEGDKVRVDFWPCVNSIEGTVIYIPCATGDSWTIKSDDGTLHEVQMFARMSQIKPGPFKGAESSP